MNQNLVSKFIAAIKDQQRDVAESAMLRPKSDPFEHGVQTGRYQGLQLALETLESLLRDDLKEEQRQ